MTCRVFVSEHGNVFMHEIAEHLVEGLVASGRAAELITGELPHPPRPGADPLDQLVVAPHEMFVLFPASEDERRAAATGCVCVNTEQPGTPFFELSMQYARLGRVAFDINPLSLDAVRAAGVAGIRLPLGYVASMDHWRRDGADPPVRDVDLGLLAGRTPRRELFVAGAASLLWEWRTDLRMFSWHRPARRGQASFLSGADKFRDLAATRILLNVHRGDDPYFEWARVVEAVANGCVVASETSVGVEPFVPGVHFLMADVDDLAEQAVALAFDEPRRAAMADAAYEVLRGELDQGHLLDRAMAQARAALGRTTPDRRAAAVASRARSRLAPLAAAGSARAARLGRTVSATLTRAPGGVAERALLARTASGLKQAYLHQLSMGRGIERAIAVARHGDADHVDVTCTPAFESVHPVISVVIPLFAQGHYLRDAVDSVVAASGGGTPAVDLVVVDDHSSDDSAEVAQRLMDERPWFPIELVRRAANGGLPVARNTGFRRARGRYVFALDADNLLYPSGLRRLAAHLDGAGDDVVAAYGWLERFDETGSLGLTSHLPWDPDLLVHGAFIDAMAMFRKDAWTELGGYADDLDVYGWEDYDLWLRAAERGRRADVVGSIVGRYREQPGSMRRISDVDMASNFVKLRERHPRLPWPS